MKVLNEHSRTIYFRVTTISPPQIIQNSYQNSVALSLCSLVDARIIGDTLFEDCCVHSYTTVCKMTKSLVRKVGKHIIFFSKDGMCSEPWYTSTLNLMTDPHVHTRTHRAGKHKINAITRQKERDAERVSGCQGRGKM